MIELHYASLWLLITYASFMFGRNVFFINSKNNLEFLSIIIYALIKTIFMSYLFINVSIYFGLLLLLKTCMVFTASFVNFKPSLEDTEPYLMQVMIYQNNPIKTGFFETCIDFTLFTINLITINFII